MSDAGEHAKILSDTAANLRKQAVDLAKESRRLRMIARKLREKSKSDASKR
jgi:hypothetical protein